jgi:hypothetical protein
MWEMGIELRQRAFRQCWYKYFAIGRNRRRLVKSVSGMPKIVWMSSHKKWRG